MEQVNELIEFEGKLSNIYFRKEDFIIGQLDIVNQPPIKFKGSLYGVEKGESLVIRGILESHEKFGEQLAIESWERPMPKSRDQITAFLSSPVIKGCGKKQAVGIVNKIGDSTIEVICRDGEDALRGIKGIGKKRAIQIVESVRASFEIQKIMQELLVFGMTAQTVLNAYKEYGDKTSRVIRENPYKLIELDKIGFLKADEIARKIGILPTSSYRIEACVEYILQEACFKSGHCYINERDLIDSVLLAINHNASNIEAVKFFEVEQSILQLDGYKIVIEDGCVYPKSLFYYEEELARKLSLMRGLRGGEAMSFLENKIQIYQKKNKVILAESQRKAVKELFYEQMLVLTGGPGTGKTTVVKAMVDVFKNIYSKAQIALVAPTGRASRKLSEVTGMEATTINQLIGWRPGQAAEFNRENKLKTTLLIIDESSMVDLTLMYKLFDAIDKNTKVLFVGDVDQLPSVRPGNVLRDLINSGLPTVRLTEIFRQAQESQIVTNAHRIKNGQQLLINPTKKDFYFIERDNPEIVAQLIVKSVLRFLQQGYKLSDILVLSPIKKGPCGILLLNEMIRESVNPKREGIKELSHGNRFFREGDKVLQTTNNKENNVYNGDIGIIKCIKKVEDKKNNELIEVMVVDFEGRLVSYERNNLDQLLLGYAITVHKSQGGEAKIVISTMLMQHFNMLARNLVYTGLTRAKEIAVFIGAMKAMNIAIQNNQIVSRNSKLTKRIESFHEENNRYKDGTNIC